MTKIKLRDWNPQKRTKVIVDIISELVGVYDIPLTVRQVHYKLVETPKANHPNTRNAYEKVSAILTNMRYAGLLDWEKIVDDTRTIYKTPSYESAENAVSDLLEVYRRDRWEGSKFYIEVWTEKKTLVRQFYSITNEYDINLASGGGFSSTTYVYEAAARLLEQQKRGKEIIVLYFGDLDPSGDFMSDDIEKRFKDWGIDLKVVRVCLNDEHVEKYNLQKRFDVPIQSGDGVRNKIESDPRAKGFAEKHNGELFQVELEALDPQVLNDILLESISEYVDKKQQGRIKTEEQEEIERVKEKLMRV